MTLISNRADLEDSPIHALALDAVAAGIEAAHPETVLAEAIALDGETLSIAGRAFDLGNYRDVVILGGGKAAGQVARILETRLGNRLDEGVVLTTEPLDCDRIRVKPASHPIPDERGLEGASDLLNVARRADEQTLVLAVVTGGGSALLPAPAGDVDLPDLQNVTGQLLDAGAPIGAINAVRKHCSDIKGGRLARTASPATVVGLVFSDVVGDDLGVIASGPTAPDPTTFQDALDVLDRFDISGPEVRAHLEAGASGDRPETPDPGADCFERVENHILGNTWTAIEGAREVLESAGYDTLVLSSRTRGEAREQALAHVAIAEEIRATSTPVSPPVALISGGETTVTVTGDGTGGPNQEFALQTALEDIEGVCVAVDTDGSDGGTDAGGAIVDSETVSDHREVRRALADNDAYSALEVRRSLIRTGPTGTNVNDLRILVLDEK